MIQPGEEQLLGAGVALPSALALNSDFLRALIPSHPLPSVCAGWEAGEESGTAGMGPGFAQQGSLA